MLKRVPFTNIGGIFRPYMDVIISNRVFSRTIAQLDTGADGILLPYSMGTQIGLTAPTINEHHSVDGISGSVSYVERDCQVGISSMDGQKIYFFKHRVYWCHPLIEEKKKMDDDLKLLESIDSSLEHVSEPLKSQLTMARESIILNIRSIQDKYETSFLLGSPFFENFEFIQFCYRKRGDANKFVYKIRESEIYKAVELT